MNIYPAMRGRMGRWDYFVVKMSMRELAQNVKFASDVYEDHTLDEAIQRVLNTSRVKKDIVTYLKKQPDRFFSSLVVAALGGEPKWFPVQITDDEKFVLLQDDKRMNETFGVLKFDGTQNYFALDGQHRLAAIKTLVDPSSDDWREAPEGFQSEEVSVIVVTPSDQEGKDEFLKRYRRLFGNLNRYAKPMDQVTNIIMDEDDVFAILTRRLITDHAFFQAAGRHRDSPRIKTRKGKNVRAGDGYFTSLEALYEMNIELLLSSERRNDAWRDLKTFVRFRPDEEVIDGLYLELVQLWETLIAVLPQLKDDPSENRVHNPRDGVGVDSALFWPITQLMITRIARRLLDANLDVGPEEALGPLAQLDFRLHSAPWRHVILVADSKGQWRMRSEDRKTAIAVAERILCWQAGLAVLGTDELEDLRREWIELLHPPQPDQAIDEMWDNLMEVARRAR